jgi:hypothetical protein
MLVPSQLCSPDVVVVYRQPLRRAVTGGVRLVRAAGCASLCLLLLAHQSTTAVAQESADPIQVCSRMTDTGARLACFDRVAAQQRAAATHGNSAAPIAPSVTAAPTAAAGTQSRAPAADRLPEDTTGLDPEQIRIRRHREGLPPEPTKVVVSTVARLEAQPSRHYHFELDNGQVWASTNAETALFLKPHETVQIRPGVFGAFFLKTEDGSTMRVYRLR